MDVQLYDSIEDGRHIVTMDLPKKIKDLEKEIDMNAIYQFELKSLELLDVGSMGLQMTVQKNKASPVL